MISANEMKAQLTKIQRAAAGNPDNALTQIEELISKKKPEGEVLQQVLYIKSMLYYRKQEKPKAQDTLMEALKAAPKSRMAAQIKRVLTQVFKVAPEKL